MVLGWICLWRAAPGSLTGIHWLTHTPPERHLAFPWLAYLVKILLLSDNCCNEMSRGPSLWQSWHGRQPNRTLVMIPESKTKVSRRKRWIGVLWFVSVEFVFMLIVLYSLKLDKIIFWQIWEFDKSYSLLRKQTTNVYDSLTCVYKLLSNKMLSNEKVPHLNTQVWLALSRS